MGREDKMAGRHSDIEVLIKEIEHIRANINDPVLGSAFWEEAMKDFIMRQGPELLRLLRELEKLRDRAEH